MSITSNVLFIERNCNMTAPNDFKKNVQPFLTHELVAEEVYSKSLKTLLIGWKIQPLRKE